MVSIGRALAEMNKKYIYLTVNYEEPYLQRVAVNSLLVS